LTWTATASLSNREKLGAKREQIPAKCGEQQVKQFCMKKLLRIVGLALVVAAVALWTATGANRGWTKTSVPVKTVDEVTGIEGITYQKQFVPGLDFLGAALFGAAILTGVSFFFRSKSKQTNNQNQ
jgi:hypothetical protein